MNDINMVFPLLSHIPDFSLLTRSVLKVPPPNYLIGMFGGEGCVRESCVFGLSSKFGDYEASDTQNEILENRL